MQQKSSIKPKTNPIHVQDGQAIEFVKRQVIGVVVQDQFGEVDIMDAFFTAVQMDARNQMDSMTTSVDHYEFTDNLGKTEVTVAHTPHGMAK